MTRNGSRVLAGGVKPERLGTASGRSQQAGDGHHRGAIAAKHRAGRELLANAADVGQCLVKVLHSAARVLYNAKYTWR